MQEYWYKHSVIYCLDVETYMDGNGDGVGDFQGLTQRLDYLDRLGINCIWLLPFYPTPNLDNGYDVKDYYNVDPRLGTLGDFVEFVRLATEHGIRVIVDLVVNHTSNEHPWFQEARRDKNSPYRDFYIWAEEKPKDAEEGIVFPGVQETTWTYDRTAQAYYHHRFYPFQPDLNIDNPAVRREIQKIMGFWLELGVSGFRVDAAPFLVDMQTVGNEQDPLAYLQEFREFLSLRRGDSILLAEANVEVEKIDEYFGEGNKMHLIFNFLGNQYLFLSLVRQNAEPLIKALEKLPAPPRIGQWANFLRNHDELSLDKLTDQEREEVYKAFAPEKNMRLYDRGIRRRLPPMLNNNRAWLEMAYSLMLTLPGTPVVRYGEEIGMGDDLSLKERHSVRTPMQWSQEANAGFSTAPAKKLPRPVIDKGEYSYHKINVADQLPDTDSFFNWMCRAIRTCRECPEFGSGKWEILETGNPAVLAHCAEENHGWVVALHNFSDKPCEVKIDLGDKATEFITELFSNEKYKPIKVKSKTIELSGYGYRWLRLGRMTH